MRTNFGRDIFGFGFAVVIVFVAARLGVCFVFCCNGFCILDCLLDRERWICECMQGYVVDCILVGCCDEGAGIEVCARGGGA